MKQVLVLGAGRTATALIEYLLNKSQQLSWQITVADYSLEAAKQKVNNHSNGRAIQFNVYDEKQRKKEIESADLVISFLLPSMHVLSARECLSSNTNLITASYVSPAMAELNKEAKAKNLIFLNEMGLDPGIDHMDAVKMISQVKAEGGTPVSFKSYCGGLITPESDNNPWGYKFTWSPMNVVLAGQGIARYVQDSRIKIVPYNRLFLNTEVIGVPGVGEYEAYPNRDSLPYINMYGIAGINNFYRGTLRKPGFGKGWNALIKLGLTDNSYRIPDSSNMTYKQWIASYLPSVNGRINIKVAELLKVTPGNEIIKKIEWLGLLSDRKINIDNGTPAEILLSLLEEKWQLKEQDRDMVILQSEIEYELKRKRKKLVSTMIYTGREKTHTAMTFTAGLPAAIAARLILQNKIKERGVIVPVYEDIYNPALKELEEYGITFTESEAEVK